MRAVLFDLDGTLADTAPDLAAALNRLRHARGLHPLPLEQLRNHASHGARGLLAAGLGMDKSHVEFETVRDAFLDHYAEALCVDTVLFAGTHEVLTEIARRGLKWGIVTNKASRFTQPLLKQLMLHERAGAVVSGDTTPQAKPHPGPLLAAAAMLEIEPRDCVYVGDAERDVAAGRAAGMRTLIARYGYIHTDEAPDGWLADGSLDSLSEVLDWLPADCEASASPSADAV